MKQLLHITICLLTLSSSTLKAQKSQLTGHIKFEDGEPAISAIVQIKELQKNLVTNINGQFTLNDLPFGNYTLNISTIEADKTEIDLAVNKSHVDMNVTLKRSLLNLNEVVVQAKSTKTKIETQGFAAQAVEVKNLSIQSIPANEILDRTAGIRIKQEGGLGSRVEYNINGLSGNSIRIFIDGTPISNYGPAFSLSSIPTSIIERIEVYKGVIPTHLSDDALGGAINIILTKESKTNLNTSYSYGSFNTHQWNTNGSFRNKKNGWTVKNSLFYNHSDNNYKVYGDKIYITNSQGKIEHVKVKRFHDQYKSAGGTLDAGFTNVKWADQMLIGVVLSQRDKEVQHGATMETVYGNRNTSQSTQMAKLSYQKQNLLVNGLSATIFASYSHINRMVIDTVPYIYNWLGKKVDYNNDGIAEKWASGAEAGSPTLAKNPENRWAGRANLAYHFWQNHTINLNYIFSSFSRKPNDPMKPEAEQLLQDTRNLEKTVLGLTLESSWLNNRLTTSLFAKSYHQTVSLKEPINKSGQITQSQYSKTTQDKGFGYAISYQIFSKLTLLTSAEKTIRLPGHTELFGNDAENINSAYQLKPEQSNNANLGFYLGKIILGNHSFSNRTNFFYRNTKDMIRQAIASQHAETYAFENQESILSTGFDTEFNYNYKKSWVATFNAAAVNARFNKKRDQHGAKYIYYGDKLRNEPYFTMNGNISHTTNRLTPNKGTTTFVYNWNYVHQFFRDWASIGGANKAIIPTQSTHDIGVTHQFKNNKIAISFDAKNIFDQQTFDNWALQKPGRAFFIKLNYKIL